MNLDKDEITSQEHADTLIFLNFILNNQKDSVDIVKPTPIRPLGKPFCSRCQIGFKSMKGLKQHEGKAHSTKEKTIKCDHCPKSFYHKYALKFHMDQVHLKVTRQQCPVCLRDFYNKYYLKIHMRKCITKS